jgi:HEAT repeat protein
VDERIPYGPAAAEATLARSAERGEALAARLVEDGGERDAGPLAWAIGAAVLAPGWTRFPELIAHPDARVRRAAAGRLPDAAPSREELLDGMARLLDDADEETRIRAATWLAGTGSRDAAALLRRLDPLAQPTPIRAHLVEIFARARDEGALRRCAGDVHAGVRAAALWELSVLGALSPGEQRDLERDPDPWIRRAVLTPARAALALRDPAVSVRREAFERLDVREARVAWAESVPTIGEPDALLRTRAAEALAEADAEGATRALLRLARDPDAGVRSVAVEALDARREQVRALFGAGALDLAERLAAHTLLRLGGDAPMGPVEPDPTEIRHVELLDDVLAGRPPRAALARADAIRPTRAAPGGAARTLGRSGLAVRPFGLSGAHDLSLDDFVLAHERGVDLFFWEPGHRELTRFLRTRRGAGAVVVAGTYHADAPSMERDVGRALRALRRDRVDVFLAFWTRSPARLDEVTGPLGDLRRRGLVRAVGISTHDRALACQAAERGLDVVMVRHSAAHRGAESVVFPRCEALATGVLTFSNLCYGRMLRRSPAPLRAPVTAADCYRYSLSQPGVHACIAAPRRRSELIEDLTVLDAPTLDAGRQEELRAHGDHVYLRSKAWSAETWSAAEHPVPQVGSEDPLSDEALLDGIFPRAPAEGFS